MTVLAPGLLLLALLAGGGAIAQERRNWFDDPFWQASADVPDCPTPAGPLLTQEEQRREAHDRIERGTSCWLAGRCADSNIYRGDRALGERVRAALDGSARLTGSSVWVTVQRQWVFLQGCVASPQQALAIEAAVKAIDGVQAVVPTLDVGPGRPPTYRRLER